MGECERPKPPDTLKYDPFQQVVNYFSAVGGERGDAWSRWTFTSVQAPPPGDAIGIETRIAAHNRQVLAQRLSDEESVEGIVVVRPVTSPREALVSARQSTLRM